MDFIDQRKQVEATLIKKAREDKEFEKLLFSDSSEALKKIGIKIPGEFDLKVVREEKGELILVYPAITSKDELSELELVNAVGGSVQNVGSESRFEG